MNGRPRTGLGAVVAWVWVLGMSLGVSWVIVNEAGESRRLRAALAAEEQRETVEERAKAEARCGKWRAEAQSEVVASTGDLGRVVVRTAAASYKLDPACVSLLGELGPVDPDAYRTAPVMPPG